MTDERIVALAFSMSDWLTGARRALHRIPEAGFREEKTQAFLVSALDKMGIACETDRTWIVARIDGERPGAVAALLRAQIPLTRGAQRHAAEQTAKRKRQERSCQEKEEKERRLRRIGRQGSARKHMRHQSTGE